MSELSKKELAKLRWHCRRGMRELDLLLEHYLNEFFSLASDRDQQLFRDLLELPDPTLFAYITGRETAPDDAMQDMIEFISRFR